MRCDQAAPILLELVDGEAAADDAAARHVERCLRCQAELAQHRRVRRGLGHLRHHLLEPDPELLGELLASVGSSSGDGGRSGLSRHRVVYVAAATAAGAAGALVLASRSRRTRLVPAG